MNHHHPWILPVLFAASLLPDTACAQVHATVPAGSDATEGSSLLWLPGTEHALRQQTVVDGSLLTGLVGRDLSALSMRRNGHAGALQGGTAHWTVHLAHAPHGPLQAVPEFAANAPSPQLVFQGSVSFPASAAPNGAAWSAQDSVRIDFTQPFRYLGGPLVVDITGTPGAAGPFSWPADAARENVAGTVTNVGDGCGTLGGMHRRWAHALAETLVAGGTAQFTAWGTPGGLGMACVGSNAIANLYPLAAVLPGAGTGCNVHLVDVLASAAVPFSAPLDPGLASLGGMGHFLLSIPNQPFALGATFATQWIDLTQAFATSNAEVWSIAPAAPSLGMATVQALASESSGVVDPTIGHVIRFAGI